MPTKTRAQVPESTIHVLTTPLSLTGTPGETGAELEQQLKAFVDSYLSLQQSVDEAKQQITEAVKAIEEREKAHSKLRLRHIPRIGNKVKNSLVPVERSLAIAHLLLTPSGC